MYRKVFNMLSLLVVLAVAFSAVAPAAASPRYDGSDASEEQQGEVEESSNGIYIVQMIDDPAVAYAGGISGLNPTKPAEGENLNSEDPDVVEYVNHLDGEHERAISESGGQKLYDYGYTYNGFAAEMTLEEAQKMTKVDGVLRVTPDTLLKLDTSSTSTFLGLDAKKGLWKKLGGNQNNQWIVQDGLKAGEQVIVEGFQKMMAPGAPVKATPWNPAGNSSGMSAAPAPEPHASAPAAGVSAASAAASK